MSSGSVILGLKTNFDEILSPGDFIMAQIDSVEEKRKVTMVLSSESVGIDNPFSENIMEKKHFKYQKAAKKASDITEEESLKK